MTYKMFMDEIENSNPDDWLYDDEKGIFVFKKDLLITIVGKEIDYEESGRFYEEWATDFPDPKAYKKEFEICYANNPIETLYTCSVDGGRMYIPYPDVKNMTISKRTYKLGEIVNVMNKAYGYGSYLERAGISVK